MQPELLSLLLECAEQTAADANLCKPSTYLLVDENGASGSGSNLTYDPEKFPEAWYPDKPMDVDPTRPADYSPSHHQSDVINTNVA
jgi:hypothetical protein